MAINNPADAARAATDAGLPGVYLLKSGTLPYGAGWTVRRPGFQTKPSNFHNGGNAHFSVLAEAKEWAGNSYGITKWARIKGLEGAYFPAECKAVIEAVMTET
jgi:hypothetical protein